MRFLVIGVVVSIFASGYTGGAEVYVVNGMATGSIGECRAVIWRSGFLLHNVSETERVVRLTGASHGAFPGPASATLPSRTSIGSAAAGLSRSEGATLWVTRLDVPPEVAVEGRLELYLENPCTLPPPAEAPFAKVPMPVFTRLAAAGEVQNHFGVDLGAQDVRLNVGIYNAGESAATALIEVTLPLCSPAPISTRTALISANDVVQVPLTDLQPCSFGDPLRPAWAMNVHVTLDQPSLSFVSTLSKDAALTVTTSVTP